MAKSYVPSPVTLDSWHWPAAIIAAKLQPGQMAKQPRSGPDFGQASDCPERVEKGNANLIEV